MNLELFIVLARGNRVTVRVPQSPSAALQFAFGNTLQDVLESAACTEGTVYRIESCGRDDNGDPVQIGSAEYFRLEDEKIVSVDPTVGYKQYCEQSAL